MINQEEIEKNYIDAKKAGEILDLSPSRISRLCSSNRFEGAFKAGGSWLIPRNAVVNFKRLRPGVKPQRPNDRRILEDAIREANKWKEGNNND